MDPHAAPAWTATVLADPDAAKLLHHCRDDYEALVARFNSISRENICIRETIKMDVDRRMDSIAQSFSDSSVALQELITERVTTVLRGEAESSKAEIFDEVKRFAEQHTDRLAERIFEDIKLIVCQDVETNLDDSCKNVAEQVPIIVIKEVVPKILPIIIQDVVDKLTRDASCVDQTKTSRVTPSASHH